MQAELTPSLLTTTSACSHPLAYELPGFGAGSSTIGTCQAIGDSEINGRRYTAGPSPLEVEETGGGRGGGTQRAEMGSCNQKLAMGRPPGRDRGRGIGHVQDCNQAFTVAPIYKRFVYISKELCLRGLQVCVCAQLVLWCKDFAGCAQTHHEMALLHSPLAVCECYGMTAQRHTAQPAACISTALFAGLSHACRCGCEHICYAHAALCMPLLQLSCAWNCSTLIVCDVQCTFCPAGTSTPLPHIMSVSEAYL